MNALLLSLALTAVDPAVESFVADMPEDTEYTLFFGRGKGVIRQRVVTRNVVQRQVVQQRVIQRDVVVQRNFIHHDFVPSFAFRQRFVTSYNAFAVPYVPTLAVQAQFAYSAPAVYAAPAVFAAPAYAPCVGQAPMQAQGDPNLAAMAANLQRLTDEISGLSRAMRGLK